MRQDISDKRNTHTQHIINTDKRTSITEKQRKKKKTIVRNIYNLEKNCLYILSSSDGTKKNGKKKEDI